MKKKIIKTANPLEIKEGYHHEIIVKPAKRLLEALLKTEEKEISSLAKMRKASTSSR
ncbi:MAG: hypothetical protein HY883_01930 [Deltaproteobacteria bacterium]|nr:hypothetical protein [Deltaproteobacteria bacterium]